MIYIKKSYPTFDGVWELIVRKAGEWIDSIAPVRPELERICSRHWIGKEVQEDESLKVEEDCFWEASRFRSIPRSEFSSSDTDPSTSFPGYGSMLRSNSRVVSPRYPPSRSYRGRYGESFKSVPPVLSYMGQDEERVESVPPVLSYMGQDEERVESVPPVLSYMGQDEERVESVPPVLSYRGQTDDNAYDSDDDITGHLTSQQLSEYRAARQSENIFAPWQGNDQAF
jgi:hypothetical protein